MADDLDSIFKKAGKKKKAVKDVASLGRRLERTVKTQEKTDRVEEEKQQREQPKKQLRQDNEESEWLESVDVEVDLNAAGIKTMELGEPEDDVNEEDEDAKKPVKTWNIGGEVSDAAVDNPEPPQQEVAVPAEPAKPRAYIAPARRQQQSVRQEANLNMESTEQFPSLADAQSIEKEKEQQKKLEEQRKLESASRASAPPPEKPKEEPRKTEEFKPVLPKEGSYVPPHLRKQMQQVQPAEPTQTNRFDALRE